MEWFFDPRQGAECTISVFTLSSPRGRTRGPRLSQKAGSFEWGANHKKLKVGACQNVRNSLRRTGKKKTKGRGYLGFDHYVGGSGDI